MSNFILFWGGPFSQWYKSNFVIDGVTYNCAEQYMMAQKALLFQDDAAYERIMHLKDPSQQKAVGRTVKNFDADKWNLVCRKVVYEANVAKFSASPSLKQIILETGDREIVEASPYDKIWGIGLDERDPRCEDKAQWQGTNWLGVAIMEARDTLRALDAKA